MNEEFPIINKNIEIENISEGTLYYIKPYIPYFIALSVFSIMLFFILGSPLLLFFTAVIIISYFAYIQRKVRHFFMQQFALTNGYEYRIKGLVEEIKAPYLQMGRNSYIEDIVTGIYKDCPIKFFNFSCTIGSGKSSRLISFTVCEIHYKTNLPRIILDSHQDFWTEGFNTYGEEVISLEGDFNKYFTLYIPKGYQIEALQIFTPDVMAKLIDKSKMFSLEFIEDHLYIYSGRVIGTKDDLYSLYELVKILIIELAPVLERLK
jgi:hypothetical protein